MNQQAFDEKVQFCQEEVTFIRDMNDGHYPKFTVKCCLAVNHYGFKHYSPSIQMTVGGDRITHDINGNDITETWSGFVESKSRKGVTS